MRGTTATPTSYAKPSTAQRATNRPRLNPDLANIMGEYLERYQGRNGQLAVKSRLNDLFRSTGATHPDQITTRSLLAWITQDGNANNTVRARLSTSRTFLRWCYQAGHIDHNPADLLPKITHMYPTTYGRAQAPTPARWLNDDQAAQLLNACKDGTWVGSRDQLAIRLGLLGVRSYEVISLTWANLLPDGRLSWTGKQRKHRTAEPGPVLLDLLARWRRKYEHELGRQIRPTDPLLCRQVVTRWQHRKGIAWGQPIRNQSTYQAIVHLRARLADLGDVAPHDLRRSAAGILHNTTTKDGAHLYDLLDIQKVLDHADPTTTMKAYLIPMGERAKQRAGHTLDF